MAGFKKNKGVAFFVSLLMVLTMTPIFGAVDSNYAMEGTVNDFNIMSSGLETTDLTDTELEVENLVEFLLADVSGIVIDSESIQYTGADSAAGIFTGGTGIIGFEEGIILSTGKIEDVAGPNTAPGTTTAHGTPGDSDLNALIPQSTLDAAVLEFDFTTDGETVYFRYVFSSEEYNEYVASAYNDVFAFFVNGENYALIEGDTPVSINNVNHGRPGVEPSNPEYFVNNDPFSQDYWGNTVDPGDLLNTEMDGLTVVLTFEAPVNPGETNTMKLAIADAGDQVLDSNVFIEAGTLSIEPPGSEDPVDPPDFEFFFEWDGEGKDSEVCEEPDVDDPRYPFFEAGEGWIHWVFTTKGQSTEAQLVLGGTGEGIYQPGEPLNAEVWHFYTPYFDVNGLTATIYLNGQPGTGNGLVISDFCPGEAEALLVSKTVETFFQREHFWDIDKYVETENGEVLEDGTPKIWLYTDGSGDEKATWTVDVTYEGFEDSDWNISGVVTIENIGNVDAVITEIEDLLDGQEINVDFGEDFALPFILEAGETLTGTYSEDDYVEGDNVITVTTEKKIYSATEPIVWGDPDEEINKTVKIKDISDLFGEVDLGSVTAPMGDSFTYSKDFAWEDYWLNYGENGPFSFTYENTATIIETEQEAEAILKVNVQRFIYESAWAKGEGEGVTAYSFTDNGFSNWGWSNLINDPYEGSWTLWAGAAQSDTSKGTDVGQVVISYVDGSLTYEFVMKEGYTLTKYDVYAGSKMFPTLRNGRNTIAPGQYSIEKNLSGEIYVIVHGVVGLPDPNFGPK